MEVIQGRSALASAQFSDISCWLSSPMQDPEGTTFAEAGPKANQSTSLAQEVVKLCTSSVLHVQRVQTATEQGC